jgi:hypothetical protein
MALQRLLGTGGGLLNGGAGAMCSYTHLDMELRVEPGVVMPRSWVADAGAFRVTED